MLCEAGAKIDIQSDDEHDTPLHDACSNGHKEVALVLLYHGANPRIQNSEGLFPHEMVDDNFEELKQILLEATKTFKETKESTDTREDSEPPMSLVTKRRSRRTSTASDIPLQLPTNGRPKRGMTSGRDDFLARDVNYRDAYRRSHLHLQALQGHGPFVRELLSIGAAHHARDRDGNSPLHLAARGGHDDAVLALLEYGAEVNALSKQGETPLHEVSGRGHKEIVQMLLFYGADPTIKDIDGRTALDVAIESPSTAAEGEVDLLKDKFVELGGVLPEEKEASVKVEEPDEMPHVERHTEETLANGRLTSPLASQSGRWISDVTAVDEGEFQEMQIDPPELPNPTSPMQISALPSPIIETNHVLEEPSQPSEPPPEPPWMKLAALDHLADSVEKEVCQLLPLYTMQFHDCTYTDQIYVAHAQICSVLGFTSQELFEKCKPPFKNIF
jgi:ankyrin repeat protein